MTQPVKAFSTIDEQIDILATSRLELDHTIATQWLKSIGYYRLSGYWYPYRELGVISAARLDQFIHGAKFDDVVPLYELDRKLRTLMQHMGFY